MDKYLFLCLLLCISCSVDGQSFASYFKECRKNSTNFDSCIKNALNDVRIFFKTGVEEYNLFPFDPFHADEVIQERGGPALNYRLKLKNALESGWTQSQVTKFKCDFNKNFVQYTQYFPEKYLEGEYEFTGNILGTRMQNQGRWNMTLYDYGQTTTISRKARNKDGSFKGGKNNYPLTVYVDVQKIGNMDIHISNLLGGRTAVLENMLDRVINTAWQPGFVIVRPLISDLVSTAFTDIFNKAFANFPFNEIIK